MRKSFAILVVFAAVVAWAVLERQGAAAPQAIRVVHVKPMEDLKHERIEAFAMLNNIRTVMGMSGLQENTALQKAAQAHAEYLVQHHLSSHFEQDDFEGFTGAKPLDRALRAGYSSRFVGENLSTQSGTASGSIHGLFSAIYHRFGFLKPSFDEVGIGIAQDPKDAGNNAFVYLMGNSEMNHLCRTKSFSGVGRYVYGVCAESKHQVDAQRYDQARTKAKERNPEILIYPYDGETEVPPVFYQEHPDPLPDYDVSGFPVSVEFNDRYFHKVALVSFRLYDDQEKEVTPVRLLDKSSDPNHELIQRQFALLPLIRLEYGTTYRAEIVYLQEKKKKKITWHFTTIRPPEALKVIRGNTSTLTLRSGQAYWLYFEPRDRHDVLGTMHYPGDRYIRFVDNNTMRVVLDPQQTRDFDITGSGRSVHIEVE